MSGVVAGSKTVRSSGWVKIAVSVLVLVVAAVSWWISKGSTSSSSSTTGQASTALTQLAKLTVAPEDTGNTYNRDDWPHWIGQGKSCDTREIALQRQGTDVKTDTQCRAVSGTWVSAYDGVVIHDAGQTDLDHVVPLAEAARSGTRNWTKDQRKTFANDLDQLQVVSARSNRQKGDQDPARWLPEKDSCAYTIKWVATKTKYHLTIDKAEHDAINGVLTHCTK
ncbi:HNH endonuclease family protein [Nocardia sp. CA2R105]|uniref:HNH endonuclease family protein n=1 Tax=Nocardia coffeae TaxID=2873381 RepID=UPI001CA6F81D|nr:HNH endonuclease family protein [Nocardia coffeae]MBY8861926.1 HNH endonuclease family protein [Nocardia coffeae]